MPTDFAEYVTKFQEDTLKVVKQTQDTNLAALHQARELFQEVSKIDKLPTLESMPTPTKLVELSFDYANKVLELRKQYALGLAELFTAVQKDATQATGRVAQAASNAKVASRN